jgi:hypothetical protein
MTHYMLFFSNDRRIPNTKKNRQVCIGIAVVISVLASIPSDVYATTAGDMLHVTQSVIGSIVPPPPPPPPAGGGGTFIAPEFSIADVRIDTHTTEAVVSWTTSIPSVATVRWGAEGVYGDGESSEVARALTHAISIEGLTPGTQYALAIRAVDEYGRTVTVEGVLFRTERLPDTTLPANVSAFRAIYRDGGIDLSWKNPADLDMERVRVVRSDIFFPEDPYDGLVVYEGRKESTRDTWIERGTTYYYAIFSEDESGNYSSGALAKVIVPREGQESVVVPDGDDAGDMFGGISIIGDGGNVPEEIRALTFSDFQFLQYGENVPRRGNVMTFDGTDTWEIFLPYDEVPEVLKTIAITLSDPDDPSKTFPFLLRVNTDKTGYVATLSPLERPGIYRVSATVLDYKHQVLKRFEGKIVIQGEVLVEETNFIGLCEYCYTNMTGIKFLQCYGCLALFAILMIMRFGKTIERKKE